MSVFVFLLGLAVLLSGLLSLAEITDEGIKYLQMSQLHNIPVLNTLPAVWVYVWLGLLLVVIAYLMTKRK